MRRTSSASSLLVLGIVACAAAPGAPDLATLTGEADAVCAAGEDVFVGDGDGEFVHYWHIGDGLVEVRRVPTNPDIESCRIDGDWVYYEDPWLGKLKFRRDPETDLVTYPAEAAVAGIAADVALVKSVVPVAETPPVAANGDAADDPVVLRDSRGNAVIVGADKQYGLRFYGSDGTVLLEHPAGRLNNVDALPLAESRYLLVASNRETLSLDRFVVELGDGRPVLDALPPIPLELGDAYGLCMAALGGKQFIFIGDKAGQVQQWLAGPGTPRLYATHHFDSQTEGCAVDSASETLFVGEEDVGVWAIDLATGARQSVDAVGQGWLVADVEGIDVYDSKYLVVSSQGDNSFVVYALPSYRPLAKFRIVHTADGRIDGVSETDGLAVHAGPLNSFPAGIIAVQDGRNRAPGANQDFKIIDWRAVAAVLPR